MQRIFSSVHYKQKYSYLRESIAIFEFYFKHFKKLSRLRKFAQQ